MSRADSWLKQAHNDYNWGLVTLKAGFYAQTCFIAQQVAEKALKALSYHKGATSIKGPGVFTLTQALKINGELEAAARTLDLYYISARYPDALPEAAAPVDSFGEVQAKTAISLAKLYLDKTDDNFILRPLKFNDLLGVFPRIDMFVYTLEEFRAALQQPSFVSDQSLHWQQLI